MTTSTKRTLVMAGILMIGMTLMTTPARAQALETALQSLAAGGNTIAGPGTFGLPNAGFDIVTLFGVPRDVCATATNIGPANMQVSVSDPAAVQTASVVITPGQTRSVCQDNVAQVEMNCLVNGCRGVWRVDHN